MKLGIALSGLLGLAISSGTPIGLAFSILAPVVWLRQGSRAVSYTGALAYYLAALRSLPVVSRNFFGPESGLINGLCFWLVAAALLALPWLWAWSTSPAAAPWRCPLALLASIVPPLGLIGWASPVTAAGLLFPAAGYAGFALTLWLPSFLLNSGKPGLVSTALVIFIFQLLTLSQPKPPMDWEAIDTNFGTVGHGSVDLVHDFRIGQEIRSQVLRSSARVIIFPEAVVSGWVGDLIGTDSKIVLVGAVEPTQKNFDFAATLNALQGSVNQSTRPGSPSYQNKLLIRGAQTGEFIQRVPIPIGMWKPFTNSGAPLNLNGPGTITVAGKRVAVLICYEQLLTWPVLTSFLRRPSLIVAVSNNVWVTGTRIPEVEKTSVQAWAALFGVPVLSAVNF